MTVPSDVFFPGLPEQSREFWQDLAWAASTATPVIEERLKAARSASPPDTGGIAKHGQLLRRIREVMGRAHRLGTGVAVPDSAIPVHFDVPKALYAASTAMRTVYTPDGHRAAHILQQACVRLST